MTGTSPPPRLPGSLDAQPCGREQDWPCGQPCECFGLPAPGSLDERDTPQAAQSGGFASEARGTGQDSVERNEAGIPHDFADKAFAAKAAGFERICLYCASGLDANGLGDHEPGCPVVGDLPGTPERSDSEKVARPAGCAETDSARPMLVGKYPKTPGAATVALDAETDSAREMALRVGRDELAKAESGRGGIDPTTRGLLAEVDSLLARLAAEETRADRLAEALFQVYVACGEDTDGAKTLADMGKLTPGIDVLAVRAAHELRADYDSDETWPRHERDALARRAGQAEQALRGVSNAYGCFASCTGALPGAPADGSGHTPACAAARDVLAGVSGGTETGQTA